eukprot:CAMPEP_0177626740 /NCGR_PEP_ID=MMETSP0419_2-20121207/30821_1 /TAXON_ID=582737 /ORGANISM="Tetraselmis sp., Strain GSL018" /LENGTH=253 /DNA_ID=CAMNT_0019127827 /DNA_START=284 /DNA_END=1042 /DNA_ORIENTATION=+
MEESVERIVRRVVKEELDSFRKTLLNDLLISPRKDDQHNVEEQPVQHPQQSVLPPPHTHQDSKHQLVSQPAGLPDSHGFEGPPQVSSGEEATPSIVHHSQNDLHFSGTPLVSVLASGLFQERKRWTREMEDELEELLIAHTKGPDGLAEDRFTWQAIQAASKTMKHLSREAIRKKAKRMLASLAKAPSANSSLPPPLGGPPPPEASAGHPAFASAALAGHVPHGQHMLAASNIASHPAAAAMPPADAMASESP